MYDFLSSFYNNGNVSLHESEDVLQSCCDKGNFIESCTVRQVPQGLIEKPVQVRYDPVTVNGLPSAHATGEDALWEGAERR